MSQYARFAVIAALVSLLAVPAFAAGPISTNISASFNTEQGVVVNVTMTNNSDRVVRVLSWDTPLLGVEADLFAVMHDGQRVPYLGRVYKRPAPAAHDFIHFAPRESRSAEVQLSAYYEMGFTGEYLINHRANDPHHSVTKGHEFLDLSSNQAVVWVEGRDEDAPIDPSLLKAKPFKPSCSASQLATIADAMAAAQGIANTASSYLGTQNSNSARYGEWFGAFNSGRWNTVDGNFAAIADALNNENIQFNCKCKQNYYAYVYPNDPYKITVCRAFWTAPLTGTDSKAGTIVHEVSHFNVVAGTDDVTYGQSSCRSLANSNPSAAITNADSHEYFAENTPFLN